MNTRSLAASFYRASGIVLGAGGAFAAVVALQSLLRLSQADTDLSQRVILGGFKVAAFAATFLLWFAVKLLTAPRREQVLRPLEWALVAAVLLVVSASSFLAGELVVAALSLTGGISAALLVVRSYRAAAELGA